MADEEAADRSGIWPVVDSSAPSLSWPVANFRKSHAVCRLPQALKSETVLESAKVWIWSAGLPVEVGTGTAPQFTLLP